MARLARVVIPGMPHHVTQRGNRRQPTFFCEEDYDAYLELMGRWCKERGVDVWAYCLMPNHVHLIAVPKSEDGLRRAIGEAHRRYTRRVNFRQQWRGHLWQGRFASFVLDEPYLLAAARYVELNPVRAGLATAPSDYRWSSARAHLKGIDDCLVRVSPLLEMAGNWRRLLTSAVTEEQLKEFGEHERTGRVLGDDEFQKRLDEEAWPCFEATETRSEEGFKTVVVYAVPGIRPSGLIHCRWRPGVNFMASVPSHNP